MTEIAAEQLSPARRIHDFVWLLNSSTTVGHSAAFGGGGTPPKAKKPAQQRFPARRGQAESVGTSTRRANSVLMASVAPLTDPRCCSGLK